MSNDTAIPVTGKTFNIMSEEQFLDMMAKYAKANNTTIPWSGDTCYLTPEQYAHIHSAREGLPSHDRVVEIASRIITEEALIAEATRARSGVLELVEERLRTF